MTARVKIDPTELDLEENIILQGAPATISPAPFDIPEVFELFRLPSGIFEINFHYMLTDEPKDSRSIDLFDLSLGRNSKRLYRTVGYCQEGAIKDCIREMLLLLKTTYPRRQWHYKALAVIIDRYLQPF